MSGVVDSLLYETEIQRERLQSSRRNLTASRSQGKGTRLQLWLKRLHTVAIQRRYQTTRHLYLGAFHARKRSPIRFARWRSALPELHRWESAIGPLVDVLQPDLIHCHDVFHLGLAARARMRLESAGHKAPAIIYDAQEFIPGLPSDMWRRKAYASLEAEYINYADRTVTVSKSLAKLLADEYEVEADIVMNAPIRLQGGLAVADVRSVIGLDPSQKLLCYVGGLAPDRGPEDLFQALPLLDDDIHLVFVTNSTDGYRTELEERAASMGLGGRVHFAPFVSPDDVSAYISTVDATVIPLSRDVLNYEVALPNKLFQSIHAGVPVVVSDNPEMARFVRQHRVGAVFAGGQPEGLADAVREVLSDDGVGERLADEKLLDEMSWERQAEKLVAVYESAGIKP